VFAARPKRLLAVVCLCLFAGAATPAVKLSEYQVRTSTTEDGLPRNAIEALCQTRDGFLWVGTPSGLARFDGVRFEVFDTLSTPEIANDNCRSLAEDTEGGLWVATDNGLLRWKDHRFQRFGVANGLPHAETRSVWPSRAGGIWIGLSRGYARYHEGRFTNYAHLPIKGRAAAYEDSTGTIWLSGDHALWRMDARTGAWQAEAKEGELLARRVQYFHEGPSGKVWLGNLGGLFCWHRDTLSHFDPTRSVDIELPTPELVDCILELSDGKVWVAATGNHILHQFENGKFIPITDENDRLIEQVTALLEDREGNVWVGTRFRGLLKLRRRQVSVYSARDGLGNDVINSICAASDGTMWIGASRGHFSRIRGGEVTSYKVPGEEFRLSEVVILPDHRERLWFGVRGTDEENARLWLWERGQLTRSHIGVGAKYIWALYDDGVSSLWIGTEAGAKRFHYNAEPPTLVQVDWLPRAKVNAFLRDSEGRTWVATENGLICSDTGKLKVFSSTNCLLSDVVFCAFEDSRKGLWIGTRHGLALHRNGTFLCLTRENGLPDDVICNILEDNDGRMCLSSSRGVHRIDSAELYDACNGSGRRVNAVSFGLAEGMISSETRSKSQPSAWKAPNGTLWFATTKGVAFIDPKTVSENTNLPPVVVDQVLACNEVVFGLHAHDDSARGKGSGLELRPGAGRVVEFRYTATSFVSPEKVAFKYRLDGHDLEWVESGTRRTAYYTNLRPGHYRFRVKACNNAGKWNNNEAAVGFYLAPHVYETWLFYAGCVGAVLLTGLGLHRRRMNVLTRIQRLEHVHQLEEERARIARDMHDDLGANLTQVAILSEVAKKELQTPDKAAEHVDRISTAARSMVDSITEIIWAIGPGNDRLDSLCAFLREQATQRCEDAGIDCHMIFPADAGNNPVTGEFRRNLLLVLKESLNNLIKHAGATRVEVVLRLFRDHRPDWLSLTVSDNGRGFEPAQRSQFKNGLGNMRARIEKLGGVFTVESQVGQGTRICAQVPLCPASNAGQQQPKAGAG
jgi:ligand-binding sensor domain-containing protein/signal transduction histidine kinase